jgi:hypothetical protein
LDILPASFRVTLIASQSDVPLEGSESQMLAGIAIFMLVLSPLFIPVMTTVVHAIGTRRK